MQLKITLQGNGIAVITAACDQLASGTAYLAAARALNHTGAKVETRVVRSLAKQVGLKQGDLFRRDRTIRGVKASASNPRFELMTRGTAIRAVELRHFVYKRPKQGRGSDGRFTAVTGKGGGVRLGGWARARTVRSGFKVAAGADWGVGKKKADGLYYRPDRDNKKRFGGFRTMYGANINKQLVQAETLAAFDAVVNDPTHGLTRRIDHELKRLIPAFS
jgi:hypothetical protein